LIVVEQHYTMREASRILGVSVRTIQRWDKAGKIRCIGTMGSELEEDGGTSGSC